MPHVPPYYQHQVVEDRNAAEQPSAPDSGSPIDAFGTGVLNWKWLLAIGAAGFLVVKWLRGRGKSASKRNPIGVPHMTTVPLNIRCSKCDRVIKANETVVQHSDRYGDISHVRCAPFTPKETVDREYDRAWDEDRMSRRRHLASRMREWSRTYDGDLGDRFNETADRLSSNPGGDSSRYRLTFTKAQALAVLADWQAYHRRSLEVSDADRNDAKAAWNMRLRGYVEPVKGNPIGAIGTGFAIGLGTAIGSKIVR